MHKPALPSEANRGRIDLGAFLRTNTRTIRSADLAARVDNLQVLDIKAIRRLILEAVEKSAAVLGPKIQADAKARWYEAAQRHFQNQIEVLRSANSSLESKAAELRSQILDTTKALEAERLKVVAPAQFGLSDAGIRDLERCFGAVLARAQREGTTEEHVAKSTRAIVDRIVSQERELHQGRLRDAKSDRIALLERKVKRLASTLEKTLGERDRSEDERVAALRALGSAAKTRATGVRSGLRVDDPNRGRRLGFLKEIVETNRELRRVVAKIPRAIDRR
ncbi:MAG: hypothetical protein AAF517_06410 [Planctomycetota bacterium]